MQAASAQRTAGIPQGITVVLTGFLPVLAIVTMFPAVGAMIGHFMPTDPAAATKVPSMVTAPGLAISIIALFAGVLVDKYGRRQLLLVSTFFYGLVGAIPFFLENLDQIYATRLLLGVCEAAILTTVNTLIADYWDGKARHNWLTLQGMVGPFLSSIMIFFAGSLAAWKWNGIFLIYLIALPIFFAMLKYMYEPESDATVRRNLGMDEDGVATADFPWGLVIGIGALTMFVSLIYYVFIVNGSLVWQELGIQDPESIGQITALPTLFILAGAGLFWWMNRKGMAARWQIAIMLGFLGSGLAVMGLTPNWQGMIAGMALQQTGAGLAVPVLIAWAQGLLPREHRGRGMGVWTATFFFGQFASPLLLGLIRGPEGTTQSVFVIAGVAGMIGGVVVAMLLRDRKAAAA